MRVCGPSPSPAMPPAPSANTRLRAIRPWLIVPSRRDPTVPDTGVYLGVIFRLSACAPQRYSIAIGSVSQPNRRIATRMPELAVFRALFPVAILGGRLKRAAALDGEEEKSG